MLIVPTFAIVVLPPTAPAGTLTVVAPTWNWVTVRIVPVSTSLSGVPSVRTLPVAVVSSGEMKVLAVAIGASLVPVTLTVKVLALVKPAVSFMV